MNTTIHADTAARKEVDMITRIKIDSVLGLYINTPILERLVEVSGPAESGKSRYLKAICIALQDIGHSGYPYELHGDKGFIEVTMQDKKSKIKITCNRKTDGTISYSGPAPLAVRPFLAVYGPRRDSFSNRKVGPSSVDSLDEALSDSLAYIGSLKYKSMFIKREPKNKSVQDAVKTINLFTKLLSSGGPAPGYELIDIGTSNLLFQKNGSVKFNAVLEGVLHRTSSRDDECYQGMSRTYRRRVGIVIDILANLHRAGCELDHAGVVLIDDRVEPDLMNWMLHTFPNLQFIVSASLGEELVGCRRQTINIDKMNNLVSYGKK